MTTSLNNLHLNQYDQAEGYLERSLAIRQRKLGSDHPYTQSATQSLQQARAMQALEAQRSEDQWPQLAAQSLAAAYLLPKG